VVDVRRLGEETRIVKLRGLLVGYAFHCCLETSEPYSARAVAAHNDEFDELVIDDFSVHDLVGFFAFILWRNR
jgi:hypothetical protein